MIKISGYINMIKMTKIEHINLQNKEGGNK